MAACRTQSSTSCFVAGCRSGRSGAPQAREALRTSRNKRGHSVDPRPELRMTQKRPPLSTSDALSPGLPRSWARWLLALGTSAAALLSRVHLAQPALAARTTSRPSDNASSGQRRFSRSVSAAHSSSPWLAKFDRPAPAHTPRRPSRVPRRGRGRPRVASRKRVWPPRGDGPGGIRRRGPRLPQARTRSWNGSAGRRSRRHPSEAVPPLPLASAEPFQLRVLA